ncbi:hypothetical protein KKA09_02740 [Patescibacteria group bacterium]|nr:hypothetical protein [Patescibacteria group bacterium]
MKVNIEIFRNKQCEIITLTSSDIIAEIIPEADKTELSKKGKLLVARELKLGGTDSQKLQSLRHLQMELYDICQ